MFFFFFSIWIALEFIKDRGKNWIDFLDIAIPITTISSWVHLPCPLLTPTHHQHCKRA